MRDLRSWGGVVAITLGISLCGGSFSFAQEVLPDVKSRLPQNEEQSQKDIFENNIPPEWGRVKEIYKGSNGSDKVIVHIQDAHCNYDAQINIGNILIISLNIPL